MFSKLFCNKSFCTFFLKRNAVVLKVASEKTSVVHSSLTVGGLEVMMARDPLVRPIWRTLGRALAQEKTVTSCWKKKYAIPKKNQVLCFLKHLSLSLYMLYFWYTTYILNMLKQQVQIVFLGTLWFLSCSPEQIGMFVLKKGCKLLSCWALGV